MPSTMINAPEWIPGGNGYDVSFTDAAGRRHEWHVFPYSTDGTARRSSVWHAWPDVPDWDRWDRPVFLHRRIGEAKNEFLLLIVHGWQRCFGYAEGDGERPIYGRVGVRRERRFILAELTGRSICARCEKAMTLWGDGCLRAHNRPRSLDRCAGSHERPAVEQPVGVEG